jgi:hypothetical protein
MWRRVTPAGHWRLWVDQVGHVLHPKGRWILLSDVVFGRNDLLRS